MSRISNYTNDLYNDYEKLQIKNTELATKLKQEKIRDDIAEDEQRRLQRIVDKHIEEIQRLMLGKRLQKYTSYQSDKDLLIKKIT